MPRFSFTGSTASDDKATKYYYKGVIVAVIVSLCAIPCTRIALGHQAVSQIVPMYIFNYAMLLTASIFFITALPPGGCRAMTKRRRRNEIYYGCCLLMCCCMAGFTVQNFRLKRFGANRIKHRIEYLLFDEMYLLTPYGMSTEFWMDIVNYLFYAAVIFMIDNCIPYRNVALYWSGATLTSEIVVTLARFIGPQSHALKHSELMHVFHFIAAVWVMFKFTYLKPRRIANGTNVTKLFKLDIFIIACLAFYSVFALFRMLGALNSNQSWVKLYVTRYEPYILQPFRFAAIWILLTAAIGIPFHCAAILALLKPGSQWLLDAAIFYAGSVLQGTFVYLSYSYYPSSDPKFRGKSFLAVVINTFLVIVAHLLMFRCLKEPSYFRKQCLRVTDPASYVMVHEEENTDREPESSPQRK